MIADQFQPLTAEQSAFWQQFPRWEQDTNFAVYLGFVVEEIKLDYARMRLPARQEMNQPAGIMHGGAIASLIDTTVVPAVGGPVMSGSFLTISMNVEYLSAVANEDAVCEGWITKRGRSISFCRAEVRGATSGKLCATASFVYKI
jgi:uncharacterized protein (TIGR00369 family)